MLLFICNIHEPMDDSTYTNSSTRTCLKMSAKNARENAGCMPGDMAPRISMIGTIFHVMPNNRIASRPIRYGETASRVAATLLSRWSSQVSRRYAMIAPSAMPSTNVISSARPTLNSVHGSTWAIIVVTGMPADLYDVPRSPRATLPR